MTWAEDRAPVGTDPSADPGAVSEGRAARCRPPSPFAYSTNAINPSSEQQPNSANPSAHGFHFTLNQDTGTAVQVLCVVTGGEPFTLAVGRDVWGGSMPSPQGACGRKLQQSASHRVEPAQEPQCFVLLCSLFTGTLPEPINSAATERMRDTTQADGEAFDGGTIRALKLITENLPGDV